jgi:Beta-propeller repeat
MGFEENAGQLDDHTVQFLSHASGYSVYLSHGELLVVFDSRKRAPKSPAETVRITLVGADKNVEPQGADVLPGITNYYVGNDVKKWHSGIRQFRQVRYSNVYPGVDFILYGSRGHLEFDFDVAPHAAASRIALKVSGATLRKYEGSLELMTPSGKRAVLKRPDFYQIIGHARRKVAGGYTVRAANELAFNVGRYDKRQSLVIDPALIYSTLVGAPQDPGGTLDMTPYAIATDSSGAAYVTGQESSGSGSAFVLKLDPTGSTLIYRTLLGGTGPHPQGAEINVAGSSIAVDANGNAYFAGMTTQSDFPTTSGAFSTTNFCVNKSGAVSCLEPFAARLDGNGKLVYSTFLAQASAVDNAGPVPSSVAVDSNGALYVTGRVSTQPDAGIGPPAVAGLSATQGAFQTSRKNDSSAFVLKLHSDGSTLDYSTYLGGSTGETRGGVAVDSSGIAYVDGGTSSADFPVTPGAYLTTNPGTAAFFTKLKPDGSDLVYSTFLTRPPAMAEGTAIAIDSSQAAYLIGMSDGSFPPPGFRDAPKTVFAAKFDASGSLVYSTLPGMSMEYVHEDFLGRPPRSSIAVDDTGAAYLASGVEHSSPAINNIGVPTIFESKLDSSGNVVYTMAGGPISALFSSFGGAALDNNKNFLVTGVAGSLADPVIPPGGTAIPIPDVGTTVGALEMVPPGDPQGDPRLIMFVQKYAQSLGAAVPVPNPRQIGFLPILQKGVTSSPRTIQLFNYGDADLAISNITIGGTNSSDFAILTGNNTCGSTIPLQSNCSFEVAFTPTVTVGVRTATVNLSFGGGLASQTVALTGQAGVPSFQANPSSVDFGHEFVGGSTNAINVIISNPGTGPLNMLMTPFFQGNNAADFVFCGEGPCGGNQPFPGPSSVPPGGSFRLPLGFAPSGPGPRSAQLVFFTDASGSPQTIQLQGIGDALLIEPGTSGRFVTVPAGQTAVFNVVVGTSASVTGTITMSCTGAPVGASCGANPSSFSIPPGTIENVNVNVPTTARTTAGLNRLHPWLWPSLATAVGIVFVRPRKRRWRRMLLGTLALLLLTALVSCGGGSKGGNGGGGGGGGNGGTPAGMYTLTVTATSPGASISMPVTLTVQ